ncbi:MAG: rod shape-determining protein MreC [Oligoflexia bacterium]|nr:rod shape-determining protein MreC [Oligoflexia bacterium]
MNIFYFRKQVLIFIVLFSVILIGLQWLNRDSEQDPLTSLSFKIFSEVQTASVNFHNSFFGVLKKYLFLLELRERNELLEQENRKLKIKQQLFEEALGENERLKKIIDFPVNQNFQLLAGEIVSADFLSKNQLLTINKGSSHGVKKLMGVLHPKGLVGYVFRTSLRSSQIITLFHPLSSLPVRNRNSRVAGLLTPSEKNRLRFDFWETELFDDKIQENFKVGDFIITMKSDQFPSGFLVGQVLPFYHSAKNINPDIYVQPFVDFNSLEEVFVILKAEGLLKKAGEENETAN